MRREHPPLHISQQSAAPCDTCEFMSACRRDGHRCRAFLTWVNSGRWSPEKRTRPRELSNGQTKPAASLRVVAQTAHRRSQPTKIEPTQLEAPATEIAAEHHDENKAPTEARCVVEAIDAGQEGTSRSESIASPAMSESPRQVSHSPQTNTPLETIVTASDEVPAMSYRESMDAHARRYLIGLLTQTGGERAAAARIAGIGRTHLQRLIAQHRIAIPFDPKARGKHGRRKSLAS